MFTLDEKNICLNLAADDRDDCIRKICDMMVENGYVGRDYADAVIVRENEYPTGLPTEGCIVAIPHSNKGEVFQTGVGIAVLQEAVGFYNMEEPEELLMAEIVFILANSDPQKQLDDLGKIMGCFSDAEMLRKIRNVRTKSEMVELFEQFEPE
jgi:PTS system galactitol-specific IIA component